MDSSTSQCPENGNSTDCLLRTLLELKIAESAEYDWDPMTFVLTLLIGLVALLLAGVTIVQALFAAGKGRRRRRRSKMAIGKWSTQSKRRWDWPEMSFRYTVKTPVLLADPRISKDAMETTPGATQFEGSSTRSPSGQLSDAASWLLFFEKAGLDEFDIDAWGANVRSVAAEYVPDDLVAAPAYVQVGAVVVAAVFAGAQSLDMDENGYPILFGPDFQVDFRQHSSLGVVCAYSRYGVGGIESKQLGLGGTWQRFIFTAKCGLGYMYSHSTFRFRKPQGFLEDWYNLQRALPALTGRTDDYFNLQMTAVLETHLPLLMGLFSGTPTYNPAMFPTAAIKTASHQHLMALALNTRYFAHAPVDRSLHVLDWLGGDDDWDYPTWEGFHWHRLNQRHSVRLNFFLDTDAARVRFKVHVDRMEWPVGTVHGSFDGHCLIFRMCLMYLHEPEKLEAWYSENFPQTRERFREILRAQIEQVDFWLSNKKATQEACSTTMFNTTMVVLHTDHMLTDGDSKKADPGRLLHSSGHSRLAGPKTFHGSRANRRGTTTASEIYSNTLEALKQLVEVFESNKPDLPPEKLLEIMEAKVPGANQLASVVDFEDAPRHRLLWDRLKTLVGYHSPVQSQWPLQDLQGDSKQTKDIEEVLVYRCVMMLLLLRTATDSTKILPLVESGIWDKIVPMI